MASRTMLRLACRRVLLQRSTKPFHPIGQARWLGSDIDALNPWGTDPAIDEDPLVDAPKMIPWKPALTEAQDRKKIRTYEEDDEDQEEPASAGGIMKSLLLELGQVAYHHNSSLPPWLLDKQREISQHRTSAQLRRCLQKWMINPDTEQQGKYLTRIGLLWHDGIPGKPTTLHQYGPDETAAYAHYFLPSRYSITKRVLNEVATLLPAYRPSRVLDFGCGPATAAAAIQTVWPDELDRYVGVDHSQSMLDAAKLLSKEIVRERIFSTKTADILKRASERNERYDLVIASYTLSELAHDPARRSATQLLFELLDVNGLLVLIEDGNPSGSHTVRAARQMVLDSFNSTDRKGAFPVKTTTVERMGVMMLDPPGGSKYPDIRATVVAPCMHDKPCPLADGVWCSFSQKVSGAMIRKDLEEKFSYVVIKKTAAHVPNTDDWLADRVANKFADTLPSSPSKMTPLGATPKELMQWLQKAEGARQINTAMDMMENMDWEDYSPPLHRKDWARSVRSPMKLKSHIIIDQCTPEGRIQRYTHSRGFLKDLPGVYTGIRKLSWGGILPTFMSPGPYSNFDAQQRAEIAEAEAARNKSQDAVEGEDPEDDDDDDDEEDDGDEEEEEEDKRKKKQKMVLGKVNAETKSSEHLKSRQLKKEEAELAKKIQQLQQEVEEAKKAEQKVGRRRLTMRRRKPRAGTDEEDEEDEDEE